MMHGAIFLAMKTEQRLFAKINLLAKRFTVFFVLSFVVTTLYTLLYIPHLTDFFRNNPSFFLVPVVMVLAIADIPRELKKGKFRMAFISSSITIAMLLIMVASEVFPYLLYSTENTRNSITVHNAAASLKTMRILLIIALIGTPLAAIYTSFVFWPFKGKVKLDETSY
jgi:cytochrome bd ubiquinol oxidase subunit II